MSHITFPIINLELNINKTAVNLLGINIQWYAIIITISIIIVLLLLKKQNGKYGVKFDDLLDLSIILLPVSFFTARLYYVLFNIENYHTLKEVFYIKQGGLAIYGAIIGGAITTYVFCKKRKINYLDMLDYIVPYIALAQSIGRWGNFVNAEAYGYETNLPWKMGIESNLQIKYVHPTFLYESISTFIIYLILKRISKNRKYSGQITYSYIVMYSFIRAIIENLRNDSLMLYKFRISQILSIILFVTFCIIIAKNNKKQKNIQK